MKRTFWIGPVAIVAATVILAGCGGSSATSASSHARRSSTTTAATTSSTTSPGATTAQYASIVAKEKVGLDKSITDLLGPDCDWTTPGNVDVQPGYLVCSLGSLTVGFQAATLSVVLDGAQNTAAKTYIGPPPTEIASLVKDTITSADALHQASTDAQDCTSKVGSNCTQKLFKFSGALSDMQIQLAAWAPYGA